MNQRTILNSISAIAVCAMLYASSGCCVNRCCGPNTALPYGAYGDCDCGDGGCAGGCGAPVGCGDCGGAGCGACGGRVGHLGLGCNPYGGGPGPLQLGIARNTRGYGCGERYWDEWISDPPDCCDPCGYQECGYGYTGQGCCHRWWDDWRTLFGVRGPCGCGQCGSSGGCGCGDVASGYPMEGGYVDGGCADCAGDYHGAQYPGAQYPGVVEGGVVGQGIPTPVPVPPRPNGVEPEVLPPGSIQDPPAPPKSPFRPDNASGSMTRTRTQYRAQTASGSWHAYPR